MKIEFFVPVDLPDGKGVPYFFGEQWEPSSPREYCHDMDPTKFNFERKYILRAKTEFLDADLTINSNLASESAIKLFQDLNVSCVILPIEIILKRSKKTEKKYFLYYPSDYIELLDEEHSEFLINESVDYGNHITEMHTRLPRKWYEKITKFTPKQQVNNNLFFCEELRAIVCSCRFKEQFLIRQLKGLDFQPLDESFVFDPFGSF